MISFGHRLFSNHFPSSMVRFLSSVTPDRMSKGLPTKIPIPGVKKVLLVSSTKGGVGKSSTTVNLALSLSRHPSHPSVGILDADVFGPSIPKMMNLEKSDEPQVNKQNLMIPLINHSIKCMSFGFLVPPEQAVVWRGLMVMQGIQKLLRGVVWGPLDFLLIDMPPGTGDVQLSICQNINVDGAIIVTTPNLVSLADVRKGIAMLNKVNVRILGMVENMSHFVCDSCQKKHFIFGDPQNVAKAAKETSMDLLARIPYTEDVMRCNDLGMPLLLFDEKSPASESVVGTYNDLAESLVYWSETGIINSVVK